MYGILVILIGTLILLFFLVINDHLVLFEWSEPTWLSYLPHVLNVSFRLLELTDVPLAILIFVYFVFIQFVEVEAIIPSLIFCDVLCHFFLEPWRLHGSSCMTKVTEWGPSTLGLHLA